MAARVTVERDDEGRLVVRKVGLGTTSDPVAEADWLRRAAGPGIVRLVEDGARGDSVVGGDGAVGGDGITTLHAGAHTWRTAQPGPRRAAAIAAEVLRTVARLHRQGLVHGAIGPDHVVLGGDGPVLCSPRAGSDDPDLDRRALADLLEATLGRWHDERVAVPAEADWSRTIDLLRRPTAGWALDDIAALLDPVAVASRSPRRRTGPMAWPTVPTWGRRAALVALSLAAVAGLTLAATALGADPAAEAPLPPDLAAATPTDHPAELTSQVARESSRAKPGPPDAGRYRAEGRDGVLVTVDHPCPGSPPAALLQPETAEVWAFASLPTPDGPVPGVAVQRVPGATTLESRPQGGCQRIVAVGPAGEAAVTGTDAGPADQGEPAR